eukprot:7126030-Pyramimonas_sp.AAC.1
MEEGASLSPQGMQNMRTLARGDLEYKSVCWAIRQLGFTTSERLLPGRGAGNFADGPEATGGAPDPSSFAFPHSTQEQGWAEDD